MFEGKHSLRTGGPLPDSIFFNKAILQNSISTWEIKAICVASCNNPLAFEVMQFFGFDFLHWISLKLLWLKREKISNWKESQWDSEGLRPGAWDSDGSAGRVCAVHTLGTACSLLREQASNPADQRALLSKHNQILLKQNKTKKANLSRELK